MSIKSNAPAIHVFLEQLVYSILALRVVDVCRGLMTTAALYYHV